MGVTLSYGLAPGLVVISAMLVGVVADPKALCSPANSVYQFCQDRSNSQDPACERYLHIAGMPRVRMMLFFSFVDADQLIL